MRVSYNWLEDYVEIKRSPEELARALTMAGIAVENLERSGQGKIRGVVVGKIRRIEPHPNADKLRICYVDVGKAELRIVTGAMNVQAGDTVPVAREGAVLAGGVRIGTADFRGVKSEGMLCSAAELGLEKESAGILILPDGLPLGSDAGAALGLDDVILELDLTSNRPDCLCMAGVAREVAAVEDAVKTLRIPEGLVEKGAKGAKSAFRIQDHASVTVQAPELCPRYTARLITDVRVGESPLWMQVRLRAAGVRPINNIVDVTNYVMLELNQPLHGFDFDQLAGNRIIVRRAEPGERITTLDGTERELDGGMLLIRDAEKAVAVAGVMGAENSEVTPQTRRVLLESAYFDPTSVRRTAKKLGLRSEASARFEKGVDPAGVIRALNRAAELIEEIGAGRAVSGVIDENTLAIEPGRIDLRLDRVNAALGTSLSADEVGALLRRLPGVEILEVREGAVDAPGSARSASARPAGPGGSGGSTGVVLKVAVPTYRGDLTEEIDLVEEVARLYGYNRIRSTLPAGVADRPGKNTAQKLAGIARDSLVSSGLSEVVTYSIVARDTAEKLMLSPDDERRRTVALLMPLSEEQAVMRATLLHSMLDTVAYNIHRRNLDVQIFELGRIYLPTTLDKLPNEVQILAGAMTGLSQEPHWDRPDRKVDFYDLKGVLETLLEDLGVSDYHFAPGTDPTFHPGRTARLLLDGKPAGVLGEVHPQVAKNYDIPGGTCLFELDFDRLIKASKKPVTYRQLPRYPAVVRDLALIVKDAFASQQVVEVIRQAGGELIEAVKLFDLYRGAPIEAGHKNLAFSLTYRASDRTLTDREVEDVQARIESALVGEIGARLRK
ncbi:MAG: phenylalanine--tRNA ligase subunit beta [Firmicutes bacterium]|nr:phenylalanine--tRNA ligase subunit beta [Bacillota bacterium]